MRKKNVASPNWDVLQCKTFEDLCEKRKKKITLDNVEIIVFWKVRLNKIQFWSEFHLFLFIIFDVANRKVKITFGTHIHILIGQCYSTLYHDPLFPMLVWVNDVLRVDPWSRLFLLVNISSKVSQVLLRKTLETDLPIYSSRSMKPSAFLSISSIVS